ncbi:MAG TPA: ATP-binding protein [Xanthobacteraceae bacterium]|jgi:signal transduction histidine kinase|nr:ATP-binding protein [Xanthobacteraceae bacterium]
MVKFMWQPQSIRSHLAAVFLLFFALVVILGSFSIWRLSNFNLLSVDVAEIWLPTTRALGDLNNYTSDFRAFEGDALLSANSAEAAATEKQMADLDRTIAEAERRFERIRHDSAEDALYATFRGRWNDYRGIVNQMLVLAHNGHKDEASQIYREASRAAYNSASDTLGQLTDQAVASAQLASDRLAAAYQQAFWLIILAIAIAGVLVVGALLHVRQSISAPLRDLALRMRRLARNDTDVEIPETGRRDEIGEMAQATGVFRNNAIELMQSQRMLAQQAALLEEKLAQEQRLTLMQRNFVTMASHEFRTPLTHIDGHARRLDKIKDAVTPRDIGERVGKIRGAVLRMTHLIDNLLNSSRLIDGGAGLYVHPDRMDLTALLREVCALHRDMAPSFPINERFASTPIPMIGDAKLLFQVFSNLLANAIKYSPARGAIDIDVMSSADEVAVTIADHGIGIPPDDIPRLFERYHRGSNVSGIVGTGVGLYLVKMAVDLHRGDIGVESREGEGSQFTVRLPRHPTEVAEATPVAPDALADV